MNKGIYAVLVLTIACLGCGPSEASKATPTEEKAFKGGPPPPGVLEKLKADSQKKGGATPPPASK